MPRDRSFSEIVDLNIHKGSITTIEAIRNLINNYPNVITSKTTAKDCIMTDKMARDREIPMGEK